MKKWVLILLSFTFSINSNLLFADNSEMKFSPQKKDLFIAETNRKLAALEKERVTILKTANSELKVRVNELESLMQKKNHLITLKNEQINDLKEQKEETNESSEQDPVGITPDIMSVTLKINNKEVEVMRNQNNNNTIKPAFAKTSRACPPFCIQPMSLGNGVETIGEVEVINYIKKIADGDKSVGLIDSRTPDWLVRGTIPGAVNVSWLTLLPSKGATTEGIVNILTEKFGVKIANDLDIDDVDEAIVEGKAGTAFDFSGAKTLVMFCNGMWCGQSPESIKILVKYGYPVDKIKYFRGGIQTWELLGFTTIKQEEKK